MRLIDADALDWGKPVGDGRPLADGEVIARLQDIKKQVGGSYAIERAIEVLKWLSSVQPEDFEWCHAIAKNTIKRSIVAIDGLRLFARQLKS